MEKGSISCSTRISARFSTSNESFRVDGPILGRHYGRSFGRPFQDLAFLQLQVSPLVSEDRLEEPL